MTSQQRIQTQDVVMKRSMNTQQVTTRSPLCLLGLLGLTLLASQVSAQVFDLGPSDPSSFETVINVPPAPDIGVFQGIGRDGLITQLNISDGGSVGHLFAAYAGSEVNMSGGILGISFSANSGSEVNISGGSVGMTFDANSGSVVNISGGSIGAGFDADPGSVVNISGGTFVGGFDADSEINISGGTFGARFRANSGSVVNVSGGSLGDDFDVFSNSEVNISGGTFGIDFDAESGGVVNLFGRNFFLDGMSLDDGLTIDDALTIESRDVTLSGLLADGSAFSFDLNSESADFFADVFAPGATLTVTRVVPEPGSLTLLGLGGLVLLGWRRKTCL